MNELQSNKCYLRILNEFRDLKQVPKVQISTKYLGQTNNIKQLFSKPQTHRKMLSEHIPKIPKLKFDYIYNKNNSPRYRILKNVTPTATAKTTRPQTNLTSRSYLTSLAKPYFKAVPQVHLHLKTTDETPQLEEFTTHVPQQLQSPKETKVSEFQSPRIMQHFDFDQHLIQSKIQAPKRSKKQLRLILLRAINKLKAMNIDPQQMIENKVFSRKPYQRHLSHEFIHAVKLNQIDKVILLLEQNRYLVFDFDFYNMTSLHWACKKGLQDMAELLIKNHADVDAVDILHRTPLYLSIQGNYLPLVEVIDNNIYEMLLKNKAYPWSTYYTDLMEVVQDNRKVQKMLTLVRRIDIINTWGDKKVKDDYL